MLHAPQAALAAPSAPRADLDFPGMVPTCPFGEPAPRVAYDDAGPAFPGWELSADDDPADRFAWANDDADNDPVDGYPGPGWQADDLPAYYPSPEEYSERLGFELAFDGVIADIETPDPAERAAFERGGFAGDMLLWERDPLHAADVRERFVALVGGNPR